MFIVNLVRQRTEGLETGVFGLKTEIWVDSFEADDSVTNPKQAIRDAVDEFLSTENGKEAIKETSEDFNWGDCLTYVPDAIWEKYGLKVCSGKSIDILVNQDEVLC